MALIRPKVLVRAGRINEPIRVPIADLLVDAKKTFLSADIASGSSTLTVKNIVGFAVNQILLIGEPGNEGSEIIKTHASSAPSGSTITLAANTGFAHSTGTFVYILGFDQVEFSTAATLTGSKSVLATSNIEADALDTRYNDTAASTGFYFARFKETIGNTFTSYSDGVPVGGYTPLTARAVMNVALSMLHRRPDDIPDEYLFDNINACQYEVLRELKRWSWMHSFDTDIGNTATGTWRVVVPTNLDDQNTQKSVYLFRIGKQMPMTWVDKEKWQELTYGVAHSTLSVALLAGATTMTLTSSQDFDDAGTVTSGANSYTYTANARSTGVLTLSTTIDSTNVASSGDDVFQGAALGEPRNWTTFGGYFYHYPVTSSSYTNRNYFADYYKSLTVIASDTDVLVIPDPTVYHYYLSWKIMLYIHNGEETPEGTAFFNQYIIRREKLKQKEVIGRTFKLRPRINDWSRQMRINDDASRLNRLGNFPDA